jgi:hypothetical protein
MVIENQQRKLGAAGILTRLYCNAKWLQPTYLFRKLVALFDTPSGFRQEFERFLTYCTRPVPDLEDLTNGHIERYAIQETCRK